MAPWTMARVARVVRMPVSRRSRRPSTKTNAPIAIAAANGRARRIPVRHRPPPRSQGKKIVWSRERLRMTVLPGEVRHLNEGHEDGEGDEADGAAHHQDDHGLEQ